MSRLLIVVLGVVCLFFIRCSENTIVGSQNMNKGNIVFGIVDSTKAVNDIIKLRNDYLKIRILEVR